MDTGSAFIGLALATGLMTGALLTAGALRARHKRALEDTDRRHAELARGLRAESLGLLARGATHDFNNILGAAGGNAELAEECLEDGESADAALRNIAGAVARGRRLSDDLMLAVHRGRKPARESRDLCDIVREAVAQVADACPPRVSLQLELPVQALPTDTDPEQMTRALSGLVRSAAQAAHSTVTIAAGHGPLDGDDVRVGEAPARASWASVTDDGPAIAAERLEQLFDPYYAARVESRSPGLDLAIAAGVAVAHGGCAGARQMPGQFRLRIALPSLLALLLAVLPLAHTTDARADTTGEVVPVKYVYATLDKESSVDKECWQTLVIERELLLQEDLARPFWIRYLPAFVGATMGGLASGYLLRNFGFASPVSTWLWPVVAGGAIGGGLTGPGGVAGGVAGGYFTAGVLKRRKPWEIVAGSLVGVEIGMAIWDALAPPMTPPPAPNDPKGIVKQEPIVQNTVCDQALTTTPRMSAFRVGYRYDDKDYDVELPYDPGEALRLDAEGKVLGRATLPY
jgi:signal transduction histidine kinase